MKKILIIHTGGTFGMVPQRPTETLAPAAVQENILTYVPELTRLAAIDFRAHLNMDSADLQPHHWQGMAELIFAHRNDYDGFVLIHGTDSLTHTAAALSFMLPDFPRPVILTGSQRPLAEIRSDARGNLIGAVELATLDIPEVCIFFGNHLLRGNRAVKISSTDYGAFVSPNYPELAHVGIEVALTGYHRQPGGTPALHTDIADAVLAFPFFPGLNPNYLAGLVESELRALVILGLGMGNVAVRERTFVTLVERLTAAGKVVVIGSQSHYGWVDLTRYSNGRILAEAGAVGSGDMTLPATLVKLMHLLGRHDGDAEAVRRVWFDPIAGEVTVKADR